MVSRTVVAVNGDADVFFFLRKLLCVLCRPCHNLHQGRLVRCAFVGVLSNLQNVRVQFAIRDDIANTEKMDIEIL